MPTPILRVISKAPSFRRAGYQFTSTPKDIALSDLSATKRAAIEGDKSLVSYETAVDDPAEVTEVVAETVSPAAPKAPAKK